MTNKTEDDGHVINGLTLSTGIAIGKAFHLHENQIRNIPVYRISRDDVLGELRRIENALKSAEDEIAGINRTVSQFLGTPENEIFNAQKLMVKDFKVGPTFEKEVSEKLVNAEQIVRDIFKKNIIKFRSFNDEVFRAKADDLIDIYRIVMLALAGESEKTVKPPDNSILLMTRLLPSSPARVDHATIAGVIIKEGGIYSHGALIARAMGIPCFCTNGQPLFGIKSGTGLVIDGPANKVILDPSAGTVKKYHLKKANLLEKTKGKQSVIKDFVTTGRGKRITFMANANSSAELRESFNYGCDGIGLYRIEAVYSEFHSMPSEEEMYHLLKETIRHTGNATITIRLIDIGGEKQLPYLSIAGEKDPSLGMRGIRLLSDHRKLFETQIRVFIRLSLESPIRVLIPVVTVPDEIRMVKTMINRCREELGLRNTKAIMPLGTMIETPAAALAIDRIIDLVDFISIGTNDLIQYTMAASRENPKVANLFFKGFDYILPLIKMVTSSCNRTGKECCVCGEVADEKRYLKRMIECGVTHFSVTGRRIPELKNYVRNLQI